MAKHRKTCHFCCCTLNNQNRTTHWPYKGKLGRINGCYHVVDCCHACKSKQEKLGK